MSDETARALAALSADADRVILADPAALRRTGTRRNRIKLATVAATVLVILVGGYAVAASPAPPPPLPGVTPSVSPTPSGSASPTSWDPYVWPPDPCDTDPARCVPPAVDFRSERLPAPCATTAHPSDAHIGLRHSREIIHGFDGTLGTSRLSETVTWYHPGGASLYLEEVRDALRRCKQVQRPRGPTGESPQAVRYSWVSDKEMPGDDSVFLSRQYRTDTEPTGTFVTGTFNIAVIRLSDKVLVVVDYGWEGTETPRRAFDSFVADAFNRFRPWHPTTDRLTPR